MEKIVTGIDHLISLLKEKKELSLDEIVKDLGVGKIVVREWLDFLEEEGMIEISHKLSKDIVRLKEVSPKTINQKKRELVLQRDSFLSKLDTMIDTIKKESEGLTAAKSKFFGIQKELREELGVLNKEIKELEELEKKKREIKESLKKSEDSYKKELEEIEKKIREEEERFKHLVEEVIKEREEVIKQERRTDLLASKTQSLKKTIDTLMKGLKNVNKELEKQVEIVNERREALKRLEAYSHKLEKELEKRKKETIDTLRKEYDSHTERLLKKQEEILDKVRKIEREIDERTGRGKDLLKNFREYFSRKARIEGFIIELEKELQLMEQQLLSLRKKALAIDAFSGKKIASRELEKLEEAYERIEKHKKELEKQLEKYMAKTSA